MSVELLKSIFDWGTVLLLGLTFLFGAGALKTGNILAKRQAERAERMEAANLRLKTDLERATTETKSAQSRLESEQRKTAEAQKSAAEAQLALKRELEVVGKARSFRNLDPEKFFKYITQCTTTQ
jgi:hypothetical protein